MAGPQRWRRVTILDSDRVVLSLVLEGTGAPDLAAVTPPSVTEVSPAMKDLVDLAGLRIEMEG